MKRRVYGIFCAGWRDKKLFYWKKCLMASLKNPIIFTGHLIIDLKGF
jgi:hypothetical protein